MEVPRTHSNKGRLILTVVAVLLLGGAAGAAWRVWSTMPLKEIHLSGIRYSNRAVVLRTSTLTVGMEIGRIDPEIVEPRLKSLPWIQAASVRRTYNGHVYIDVLERLPVALLMWNQEPAAWVAPDGRTIPLAGAPVFDVPLLYPPARDGEVPAWIRNHQARLLLAALDHQYDRLLSVISDIHIDGQGRVDLNTVATPRGEAIPVALGRDDFEPKLKKLNYFWYDAVVAQPEHRFKSVDLRFDDQIVAIRVPDDSTLTAPVLPASDLQNQHHQDHLPVAQDL